MSPTKQPKESPLPHGYKRKSPHTKSLRMNFKRPAAARDSEVGEVSVESRESSLPHARLIVLTPAANTLKPKSALANVRASRALGTSIKSLYSVRK